MRPDEGSGVEVPGAAGRAMLESAGQMRTALFPTRSLHAMVVRIGFQSSSTIRTTTMYLPFTELNVGFSNAENYQRKENKELLARYFVRDEFLDRLLDSKHILCRWREGYRQDGICDVPSKLEIWK